MKNSPPPRCRSHLWQEVPTVMAAAAIAAAMGATAAETEELFSPYKYKKNEKKSEVIISAGSRETKTVCTTSAAAPHLPMTRLFDAFTSAAARPLLVPAVPSAAAAAAAASALVAPPSDSASPRHFEESNV